MHAFLPLCRAWKTKLIEKVPDRNKLVSMHDDLGDLMYAPDEASMMLRWHEFQQKYHSEEAFIKYFHNEWMGKTGIVALLCSVLPYLLLHH